MSIYNNFNCILFEYYFIPKWLLVRPTVYLLGAIFSIMLKVQGYFSKYTFPLVNIMVERNRQFFKSKGWFGLLIKNIGGHRSFSLFNTHLMYTHLYNILQLFASNPKLFFLHKFIYYYLILVNEMLRFILKISLLNAF